MTLAMTHQGLSGRPANPLLGYTFQPSTVAYSFTIVLSAPSCLADVLHQCVFGPSDTLRISIPPYMHGLEVHSSQRHLQTRDSDCVWYAVITFQTVHALSHSALVDMSRHDYYHIPLRLITCTCCSFGTQPTMLFVIQCRSATTYVRVSVSIPVCSRKLIMTSYSGSVIWNSITWLL